MLVVTADEAGEAVEERVGLPPDMVAVQLVFARRDVEAAASVEAYVDRKLANLRAAVLAEFRAQGWR